MALPKFLTKPQFMRLVTSGVIYPNNVQLRDIQPLQENAIRCFFLVDFPIAKNNVELTLTLSPEEHTQESAIRLLNEKLQQCARIEFEDTQPLMAHAEQMMKRLAPRNLVVTSN